MATPAYFTTLGALHDTPSGDVILDRLKELARATLPDGWREWTLLNSNDLDFMVDSSVLNKVRFALPTLGISQAFNPSATSLKELPYKQMKTKMLSWAFCRGLVFSPSNLSKQIRGSCSSHEAFIQAIASMKPLLMSREAADRLLSDSGTAPVRRTSSSPAISDSLEARFAAQDERIQRLESAMDQILKELQKNNKTAPQEEFKPVDASSSSATRNTHQSHVLNE